MVFSNEEIRKRMQKYGSVYFPDEIKDIPEDLLGIDKNKEILDDFFKTLKKYKKFSEKLKEVRMTPSITVLLYGPPGTGKTSITRALAKKYEIPMCIVDADRLVSPLLGDTLKNMRNVVELAAEIAKENKIFLLFFDEIDAIASERSSAHEVGEIKRAVISFLQIIDKIDYEGIPLAIFGATNHQDSLDSAVWRRFVLQLFFGFPDFSVRKEILIKFLKRLEEANIKIDDFIYTNIESEAKILKDAFNQAKSHSISTIDALEFEDAWVRNGTKKNIGLLTSTRGYTGADIERGIRVALLKAIQEDVLQFEMLFSALQFTGGTRLHVEQQLRLSNGLDFKSARTSNQNSSNIKPNSNKRPKKKILEI